jgi:hypothetical protein
MVKKKKNKDDASELIPPAMAKGCPGGLFFASLV